MKKSRLISWNVNGIRAVQRKNALDWFYKEKPFMLCLQETKAMEEQFPKEIRELDGYHVYSSSAERKGYSGVAIFSQRKPVGVKHGLGVKKFDTEGCVAVGNNSMFEIANYVELNRTPIVIFEKLPEDFSPSLSNPAVENLIEQWRQAWEKKDLEAYISFYDKSFTNRNMNLQQWKSYKGRLNKTYEYIHRHP